MIQRIGLNQKQGQEASIGLRQRELFWSFDRHEGEKRIIHLHNEPLRSRDPSRLIDLLPQTRVCDTRTPCRTSAIRTGTFDQSNPCKVVSVVLERGGGTDVQDM